MQPVTDASHLYPVERRRRHAEREGFRINELQISPAQRVPWHYHSHITDTFYVLSGKIEVVMRDPVEHVVLTPGDTYTVAPRRPHLVVNPGGESATFLVLQGIGEYDFVALDY